MTANQFQIVVGENNVAILGDEQEYHKVNQIIIHESFNESKSFEYDFAIIKLIEPVILTPKVDLVNLPLENMHELAGKSARVLGWGLNENDTQPTLLKEIQMVIFPNLACKNNFRFSKVKFSATTDNHICALSADEKSATCFGDSGGEKSI